MSYETHQARFYKATSIAKMLDVHPSTVWRWAEKGYLPRPIRFSGGVTRWRATDIDSILKTDEKLK